MISDDRQRIDKWLWFARLAKTRTAAQKLAVSGKVRVNRKKSDSASRIVCAGDVLTIAIGTGVRVLQVVGPGQRRGPPPEARLLYVDLTPPPPVPETIAPAPMAQGGRPTKRDRRRLVALKQGGGDSGPGDA